MRIGYKSGNRKSLVTDGYSCQYILFLLVSGRWRCYLQPNPGVVAHLYSFGKSGILRSDSEGRREMEA